MPMVHRNAAAIDGGATMHMAAVRANRTPEPVRRLSEPISAERPEVFAHSCRLGAEGIAGKRLGSAYRSGRAQHGSNCAIR
jgi:hypothetical protein